MMTPFSFQTGHSYSRAHGFYIFGMLLWYSHTRPNKVDDVKSPTRRIRQNDNPTNSNFQHQYPDGAIVPFYSSKIGRCFPPFNSNNSVIDVVVNTLLSLFFWQRFID